jgi:hypothetical protein
LKKKTVKIDEHFMKNVEIMPFNEYIISISFF